jgi:hypothetical protein
MQSVSGLARYFTLNRIQTNPFWREQGQYKQNAPVVPMEYCALLTTSWKRNVAHVCNFNFPTRSIDIDAALRSTACYQHNDS